MKMIRVAAAATGPLLCASRHHYGKQRIIMTMTMTASSPLFLLLRRRSRSRSFSSGSGIDVLIENQIKAWKDKGGEDTLLQKKKGKAKRLEEEGGDGKHHRHLANSLGVGADYLHSKILADNNIKPESIERRLQLDKQWNELQTRIRRAYDDYRETEKESSSSSSSSSSTNNSTPDDFANLTTTREMFVKEMEELDRLAKRVNDAIISDSLRFNGRCPVPHARRFQRFEERIVEALTSTSYSFHYDNNNDKTEKR